MCKSVLFNFFLLVIIFLSLYNEYLLTTKCKIYLRKKDLVINKSKKIEDFSTLSSIKTNSSSAKRMIYKASHVKKTFNNQIYLKN
jgi:hypothetical protein